MSVLPIDDMTHVMMTGVDSVTTIQVVSNILAPDTGGQETQSEVVTR